MDSVLSSLLILCAIIDIFITKATGAYLSLGNVTNNNASIGEGTSSITIEFSLTVLNDSRAGFSDSELRWITAGVEFANGVLLWVGQLGYYLQAATTNVSVLMFSLPLSCWLECN